MRLVSYQTKSKKSYDSAPDGLFHYHCICILDECGRILPQLLFFQYDYFLADCGVYTGVLFYRGMGTLEVRQAAEMTVDSPNYIM